MSGQNAGSFSGFCAPTGCEHARIRFTASYLGMTERCSSLSFDTPEAARTESRLRLLVETGLALASTNSLDRILETALDAGLQLSGARCGVFFYAPRHHGAGSAAGSYTRCKLAGIAADEFEGSQFPAIAANFNALFRKGETLRSEDIPADPRFADPRFGMAAAWAGNEQGNELRNDLGDEPIRSLLAVPVQSQSRGPFGLLVYAHGTPGRLTRESEQLVSTVAAQAALAMAHAQLHGSLRHQVSLADAARADQRITGRRLAQALEAAQLGTWSWDAVTGLVDFDERAAALFGVEAHVPLPRSELRARLLNLHDLRRAHADLKAVLAGNGSYTAEYRIASLDGSERWIAVTGNATQDAETGRATGMIGTLQDVTPRKLQESTLRTSEKLAATGRLAATIAHEINNPLEAVTNLIYLAKTDPVTPTAVCRLLETADTELARVSQIAQQTLGFYRDTTRPVSVDLNDLLRAVVNLFDRKLTGKRLQCTLDLEPGLTVVGLQGEIRQVVSNLLVNAIDASHSAGGRIRIRARARRRNGNRGVFVLISDQGSGIPHEVRPRLFTPFTTTKQSLGTGLGLWVTQGMVEKHGGSVRFRSRTAHPSGTIFRVYFPESGSPQLFAHQSAPVLQ